MGYLAVLVFNLVVDFDECGKMMCSDSEVEIDIVNNEVWLCDYSENRGGAEFVKMLCKEHDVKSSDIDKMCNKNNWAIVL